MPIASVRAWLGITLTLGLLVLAPTPRLFAISARPNFLIILTDDHGYGDVSTYEEHNLRAERPALVRQLSALLRAHIQDGGRTSRQPPQHR